VDSPPLIICLQNATCKKNELKKTCISSHFGNFETLETILFQLESRVQKPCKTKCFGCGHGFIHNIFSQCINSGITVIHTQSLPFPGALWSLSGVGEYCQVFPNPSGFASGQGFSSKRLLLVTDSLPSGSKGKKTIALALKIWKEVTKSGFTEDQKNSGVLYSTVPFSHNCRKPSRVLGSWPEKKLCHRPLFARKR
jgi:hypothetical protein